MVFENRKQRLSSKISKYEVVLSKSIVCDKGDFL